MHRSELILRSIRAAEKNEEPNRLAFGYLGAARHTFWRQSSPSRHVSVLRGNGSKSIRVTPQSFELT